MLYVVWITCSSVGTPTKKSTTHHHPSELDECGTPVVATSIPTLRVTNLILTSKVENKTKITILADDSIRIKWI